MIKQVSAVNDLSLNSYSNGLETVVSLCLSVPLYSSEFHDSLGRSMNCRVNLIKRKKMLRGRSINLRKL